MSPETVSDLSTYTPPILFIRFAYNVTRKPVEHAWSSSHSVMPLQVHAIPMSLARLTRRHQDTEKRNATEENNPETER